MLEIFDQIDGLELIHRIKMCIDVARVYVPSLNPNCLRIELRRVLRIAETVFFLLLSVLYPARQIVPNHMCI